MVREGKFWGHLQFTQHLCKAVRGCNLRDGSCIDRLGLQGIWIAATFEGRPSRSFRQQLRTTEGLQRKCSHVMCWKHAPGPEEQPRDLTQSVHDGCRAFLALLGPPDDILGLPLQSTSLGMLHFSRDIGILSLEGFLEVVEVVNSTLPFEAFQSPEIE